MKEVRNCEVKVEGFESSRKLSLIIPVVSKILIEISIAKSPEAVEEALKRLHSLLDALILTSDKTEDALIVTALKTLSSKTKEELLRRLYFDADQNFHLIGLIIYKAPLTD